MNEKSKDSVKFTDEEMAQFKDLSSRYQENLVSLGQLYISRLELEEKNSALNEEEKKLKLLYASLQKLESELLNKITEKYGDGSLDPKTGIFTPIA